MNHLKRTKNQRSLRLPPRPRVWCVTESFFVDRNFFFSEEAVLILEGQDREKIITSYKYQYLIDRIFWKITLLISCRLQTSGNFEEKILYRYLELDGFLMSTPLLFIIVSIIRFFFRSSGRTQARRKPASASSRNSHD